MYLRNIIKPLLFGGTVCLLLSVKAYGQDKDIPQHCYSCIRHS